MCHEWDFKQRFCTAKYCQHVIWTFQPALHLTDNQIWPSSVSRALSSRRYSGGTYLQLLFAQFMSPATIPRACERADAHSFAYYTMILGPPEGSKICPQMLNLNGGVLGVVDEDLVRRVEALLLLFLRAFIILAPSCKKAQTRSGSRFGPWLGDASSRGRYYKVLCICNYVLPFSKITHFSQKKPLSFILSAS